MNARQVFRTLERLTEQMARATMPATAAADPVPEPARVTGRVWRMPAMAPLTFTMAEAGGL